MRNRFEVVNKEKIELIVIIGVGCWFFGNVNDLELFWYLLYEGIDVVGEVLLGCWDVDVYYDLKLDVLGKIYIK